MHDLEQLDSTGKPPFRETEMRDPALSPGAPRSGPLAQIVPTVLPRGAPSTLSGGPAPVPLPKWRRVPELSLEEFVPTKLRARISAVNKRVSDLSKARAVFDDYARRTWEEEDPTKFDFANLIGLPAFRVEYPRVLQQELEVRRELAECEGELNGAIAQEAERALGRLIEGRKKLRAALAELGYLDVDQSINMPGKITNGMIESNPRIAELRAVQESLSSRVNTRELARQNQEEMGAIEVELGALMRRAVARVA